MSADPFPLWPAVPISLAMDVERTEGAYIYTTTGEKILDAAGQACVANIGYGNAEVAEAVAAALKSCTHVLPPFSSPQRLALLQRLRDKWLPPELSRIHLVNSGSEAADSAIKLARQYHYHRGNTDKWKVIGRDASYHGITLGALAVSGHDDRRRGFEPLLADVPLAKACYPYRCDMCRGESGCNLRCAEDLETIIQREGADTVAAFMAEVIVGTSGGALVPHDDYWPAIQDICRRHDVLLIVDEVITGFGRTGRKFAVEHWNIKPDILTTAKGFSGGYAPIAAVATTDAVIQPLVENRDMMMFHTFGGHPAACAAADKVLEIIEREDLVQRAAAMGAYIEESLSALKAHPLIGDIRGKGLLWGIEVVKDKTNGEQFPREIGLTFKILEEALKRGVLLYFGGTGVYRDIICIGPSFTIEREEIDTILDVLVASINGAVS